MSQKKPVNDVLFNELNKPGIGEEAVAAVNSFTRDKMHRLRHIPNKYYLPPAYAAELGVKEGDVKKLYAELDSKGYINLDHDGEPCVLSGKPSVMKDDE